MIRHALCALLFLFLLIQPNGAIAQEQPLLRSSIPLPKQLPQPFYVKVAILRGESSLTLSTPFPYTVSTMPSFLVVGRGNSMQGLTVKPASGGIEVGGKLYAGSHIRISTDQGYFAVNKREYRDHLHIVRDQAGKLLVINEVDIENYIKGVLPWEANPEWPMEALKAHAVVSRTYGLFRALDKQDDLYFLEASVLSQVYRGKSAEKPSTSEAVDATRGEILTFRNEIFPAFFHSCCGGHTTRADLVWRIKPNAVLSGVVCPYCIGTKHYHWESAVSLSEVESKIRERGYTISPISNIQFDSYDASGRAKFAIITHAKGTLRLLANDFRLFVGPELIRSTKAKLSVQGGEIRLQGFGWGHGAGFCQWGAKNLSDFGKPYREIVAFYYPGSSLKRIYKSERLLSLAEKGIDKLSELLDL